MRRLRFLNPNRALVLYPEVLSLFLLLHGLACDRVSLNHCFVRSRCPQRPPKMSYKPLILVNIFLQRIDVSRGVQ